MDNKKTGQHDSWRVIIVCCNNIVKFALKVKDYES
jgi:hypothetical protein